MRPASKERDAAILAYIKQHSGRVVTVAEIRSVMELPSADVTNSLVRAMAANREIVKVGHGTYAWHPLESSGDITDLLEVMRAIAASLADLISIWE